MAEKSDWASGNYVQVDPLQFVYVMISVMDETGLIQYMDFGYNYSMELEQ